MRGVRSQAVAARTAGDGSGREVGGFEEELGRLERDAAVLAAHDAGHGERLLVVGDHQHVGVDGDGLFVEQQGCSPGFAMRAWMAPESFRVVEGVQRLPEFEHDVVGDVDQRGDGARRNAMRRFIHSGVGALALTPADDAAAVARAGLPGRRARSRAALPVTGHVGDLHVGGRRTGERRDFAGDAGERQAVGAVRRELERQQAVVEVEVLADVCPTGASAGGSAGRRRPRRCPVRAPSRACRRIRCRAPWRP